MTAMTALDRRSDFVSAVAVELADLAPDDRAELIEELDDHIAALLEDRPEVDLATELGTPRAYAAELRSAAGLTRVGDARAPLAHQLRETGRRIRDLVPQSLQPYLAGIRPTWWVARGYLLAAGITVWTGAVTWAIPFVPSIRGNWVAGGILTIVAVLVSIRLGTRHDLRRSWRLGILALDLLALVAAVFVTERMTAQPTVTYDSGYVQACTDATNLYPYDGQGRPLTGVRLVDQAGQSFDLSAVSCDTWDMPYDRSQPGVYPYPTAPAAVDGSTGPPESLAPLPGATVSSTTPSPTGTPSSTGTP